MEWSELSEHELVKRAADSPGNEPAARWQAQAEGLRRVRAEVEQLRTETSTASRRLNLLTVVLVIATIVLVVIGVITLIKVW